VGQEILYCGVCSTQLRSSDWEKGSATKVGLEAYCKKCIPEALKTLSPDKAQALLTASTVRLALPPSDATPKRASQRIPIVDAPRSPPEQTPKRGSQRIPVVETPRTPRRPLPAASSPAILVWLLLGAVGAGVLVVALASGRPPAGPPAPPARPPSVSVEPEPPPPAPPSGPTPRERKAVASLKAAAASGLEADFEKALADARGTALEEDARKALDAHRAAKGKLAEAEIEAKVRAALEAEQFLAATQLAPARASEFLGRAAALFAPLRETALDALRRGAKEDIEKARARAARWGVGTFAADLDKALADAAKPAPPPPPPPLPPPPPAAPSAEAIKAAREAAREKAGGRQFAEALAELAKVPTPETAEDVELLKAVAALHAEAWAALGKLSKGRKLAVTLFDYDFQAVRYEGTFVRVHDHKLELLRGKTTLALELGQMMPRSFPEWLPSRERRIVAAACLAEGDEAGALELLKNDRSALPARWWEGASEYRARHTGEPASHERNVSYKYYAYMQNLGNPATRAEGALAMAQVAREERHLPWVARHLPLLESRAELAREFAAGPDVLRAGGAFRLETDRERAFWTSAADGDPARRRETFVEMDFSVLPDVPYRAWAYIGACCAETAAFAVQGTDFPAADDAPPLKHAFLAATKTHASHGGRKQPSRWSWIEIPLPAGAAPGAKTLRLATNQQGFSVGWILVSSTREKPFTEAELKERDRELPRGPGPLGPTLGLQAWFRSDAGAAAEGGRVGRWLDQSGRQRHASQPDPAARPLLVPNGLNNRPSLRFDGASSALAFESAVNGLTAMTLIVVAQPTRNVSDFEMGRGALLHWREQGPWGAVFVSPQQRGVAWRFGSAMWGNQPSWMRPNNEVNTGPVVLTVRKDGPREDLFAQGSLVASLTDRKYPLAHTPEHAWIGSGTDDNRKPPGHWAGDVGEILVYARALPDAERGAVEALLRQKFGF
jgi:hypothetical protein